MKKKYLAALVAAGLGFTSAPAISATLFSYTGSVVSWTADTTGEYRIVGVGAQGYSATTDFSGGRGASIAGTFTLTAGTTYYIAVGGAGSGPDSAPAQYNGGGGGGTFFVDASNNPLLVAGGGGGTRSEAGQNGTDASITAYAYTGSGSSYTYTAVLKSTDLGFGGIVSAASYGSGGAGFYGNGANDSGYGTGGASWANGLAGGTSLEVLSICLGNGGFGGGGAGAGCGGGGGGGGYSGGDGGFIAGGGGSWNLGVDQIALAGAGYGNGSLSIELISGAVPEPATWAMMIAGLGAVGASMRRRKAAVSFA